MDPYAGYAGYPGADQGAYSQYGGAYQGAYGGYAQNVYAPPASADEVRTIFITGFPTDVKERELNNMLRFMPGYEASQMTWKNGQAQGFALFNNAALARGACDHITQLIFDENSTLRCEMARKNMYIKELDQAAKKPRVGQGHYTGASTYPAPQPAAAPAAHYSKPMPQQSYQGGGGGGAGGVGDNPPCNTLFIGNLSEHINETELNSFFVNAPGFRQLKIVRGRNTTAFVEFDTTENAVAVHNSQQGAILQSNIEKGGMRIQFSRNPFGKKRDVTGAMIDTPVKNPDFVAPSALGPPVTDVK